MIADLGMYDWPGTRAANDAFWSEVARRLAAVGIEAPAHLARVPDAEAVWPRPDLVIAQTCGMPYVSGLCGDAALVGRPDYGLAGAEGGSYRSAIIARRGAVDGESPDALLSLAGAEVAVNGWASYSGHVTLRAHLAGLRGAAETPFFGKAVISGGHLLSARMVAEGRADAAAMDWVSWEMLAIQDPETAARLMLVDRTDPAPALPFITAAAHADRADVMAACLDAAARALPPVTGVPRRVMRTQDGDYDPTRAAARRAAQEKFAPNAPDLPSFP